MMTSRGPRKGKGRLTMALRHAVLAALLDGELQRIPAGQGVRHRRRQLLARAAPAAVRRAHQAGAGGAGRRAGRWSRRPGPTSACSTVTDAGRAELERFTAAPRSPRSSGTTCSSRSRPPTASAPTQVIAQLEERAAAAEAKIELLGDLLRRMRGEAERGGVPATRRTDRPLPDLPARPGLRAGATGTGACGSRPSCARGRRPTSSGRPERSSGAPAAYRALKGAG